MKRITIDGKEYTIEFSIEATLYSECTESVMNMIMSAGVTQAEVEQEGISDKEKVNVIAQNIVKNSSDIPQRALTLFYAGLLEHHGTDSGDGSVKSKKDAKRLLVAYLREHKEENDGKGKNLYDVMGEMMEQMAEDSFFEQIGIDKMMNSLNNETKKMPKTPQDHKKLSKSGKN